VAAIDHTPYAGRPFLNTLRIALTCLAVTSSMAKSGPNGEKNEQKRIPLAISNLLDVAVYSFGSMKGLCEDH